MYPPRYICFGSPKRKEQVMIDELRYLYAKIANTVSVDMFEHHLRYLLKQLALDLKKESSNKNEKLTVYFVRYEAPNLANIISRTVRKRNDLKSRFCWGKIYQMTETSRTRIQMTLTNIYLIFNTLKHLLLRLRLSKISRWGWHSWHDLVQSTH